MQTEYSIVDPAGLAILARAAEAYERMRQAQAVLATKGLTTQDRFGQSKAHPAVAIERDSRAAMLGAIKALHLDVEPLCSQPGRQLGVPLPHTRS